MMPLASIDRLLRRAFRDRQTHFVELTRHFFLRFFDNEWIARNAESRLTLIHVLALLAVPGALCSFYLYPIYDNIGWHHPELFPAVALVDQCRFVGFTLVVVGFVATLEWNALFPDRRDYTVLAPLPLRMSALFLAKAAALLLLLAVFTAAVNLFSGIIYPCVAMTNRKVTPWDLARWFVAHGLSVTAASAFGLLFFVALQGLLINTLPYRLFRKASVYVQAFSLMLLLALLLLLDSISSLAPAWAHTGSMTLDFLPPMWFLGIYETLLGSRLPVFRHLAHLGLAALGLAAVFSLAGYALAYRRHVQKSIESADAVDDESSGARTRAGRLLDRLIVRTPLERAAFHFLVKTLFRSAKHRLYFAAYVGAGFAFVLVGCVETFVGSTHIGRPQPAETLLSIPLILSFFTLSGMRMVFTVPAALDANWIFQLTEDDRRHECLTGVRKAMVAIGIAPLFAALFPLDVYLWGWSKALVPAVFGVTLSLILVELLLLNFRKIPFTCSYLPGKANITVFGVLYWLAFSTYAYTMAGAELWILREPILLVVFAALAFPALAWLVAYRRRHLRRGFTFVFDDRPEPAVRCLRLTEWEP